AARYLAHGGDARTLIARFGEVRDAGVRRALREGLVRRAAFPRAAIEQALGGDAEVRVEAAWLAGASGDASLAPAVARAVERAASGVASARREVRGAAREATETAAWHAALWAARRTGAAIAPAATAALADATAPANVPRE